MPLTFHWESTCSTGSLRLRLNSSTTSRIMMSLLLRFTTAKKLSEIVLKKFTRKKKVITEPLNRAIRPDEFHLVSARAGHFPGVHSLTFDSAADTIDLTHTV